MSTDLGLALISDPDGDHSADLVFIHGLGGHRSRSFTNKHSEFWPPWVTKKAVPRGRVWTYGYNGRALLGSEDDLTLHATKLLRALVDDGVGRMKGTDSNRPPRPVVFLAHSLGGIVVKKAMVIASRAGQSWSYLFSTTPGIIFMGTPHRGSHCAQRLFMATALSQTFLPRSHFLHILRDRSSMLATLAEQFNSVWGPKHVLSFRETARVGGIGTVVEPKYAVTNCRGEVVVDVPGCNHIQICKPESMQSPLFQAISKHLVALVKDPCRKSSPKPKSKPKSKSKARARWDPAGEKEAPIKQVWTPLGSAGISVRAVAVDGSKSPKGAAKPRRKRLVKRRPPFGMKPGSKDTVFEFLVGR